MTHRTTITLPDELAEKAEAINTSEAARDGIRNECGAPGYYWFNSNRARLPDRGLRALINGVVATYDTEQQVEHLQFGDRVFLYVNDVGVVACGWVTADGTAEPVPDVRKLYPTLDKEEYHADVYWDRVLPPQDAIDSQEVVAIANYPVHGSGTFTSIDSELGERLWSLLDGRSP